MPSVHYKFKSSLDYKTLMFEGIQISVGELKKLIYDNEKIGKSADFDLQITNAQTKQVYEDESSPVQRNASVIVARVPTAVQQKLPKVWDTRNEGKVVRAPTIFQPSRSVASMLPEKNDLAMKSDLTEDEKLKLMQHEATQDYDPSQYQRGRHLVTSGPAPATLRCNKCGQSGHWLKDCPLLNVRRPTGIPKDELMETTPDDPQAMLTSSGRYVVSIMDKQAHLIGKKERPPFFDDEPVVAEPEPKKDVPSELTCPLCNDLLREAVVIPCCGYSFCDECVRNRLLESEYHECPHCGEKTISPDSLVPNSQLRRAVSNFRNEMGYIYAKHHRLEPTVARSDPSVGTHPPSTTSGKLKINFVSVGVARATATDQRLRASNVSRDSTSSPAQQVVSSSTMSPDVNEHDSPAATATVTSSSVVGASTPLTIAVTTASQRGAASTKSAQITPINSSMGKITSSAPRPAWPPMSVPLSAPIMSARSIYSTHLTNMPIIETPYLRPPVAASVPAMPPPMIRYPQQPQHQYIAVPPPPGVGPASVAPSSSYPPSATSFMAAQPPPPGVPTALSTVPAAPIVTAVHIATRPPFMPSRRPLTEEEFYDAKRRMLESRLRDKYRSPRPQDAWEEFLARKDRRRRRSSTRSSRSSSRSRSRSSGRSRQSRSRSSSRSRTRSRSPSYHSRGRRRHERSRSRYRSRSRVRSRTRSRSPRPRLRRYNRRSRRSPRSRSRHRERGSASSKTKRSPRRHQSGVSTLSSHRTGGGPVDLFYSHMPTSTTSAVDSSGGADKRSTLASFVGYATTSQTTPSSQSPIVQAASGGSVGVSTVSGSEVPEKVKKEEKVAKERKHSKVEKTEKERKEKMPKEAKRSKEEVSVKNEKAAEEPVVKEESTPKVTEEQNEAPSSTVEETETTPMASSEVASTLKDKSAVQEEQAEGVEEEVEKKKKPKKEKKKKRKHRHHRKKKHGEEDKKEKEKIATKVDKDDKGQRRRTPDKRSEKTDKSVAERSEKTETADKSHKTEKSRKSHHHKKEKRKNDHNPEPSQVETSSKKKRRT